MTYRPYLLVTALFISSILTLTSKTKAEPIPQHTASQSINKEHQHSIPEAVKLHKAAPGLATKALNLGLMAYKHAEENGGIKKSILTIIDYSLPSTEKRMWVFDVEHQQLLYNTYVAHGKNSGDLYATHFSNTPQSKETSLGAYITQNSYIGGKGLSLNLKGLESGYNTNALSRRVVIHGAWYVQPDFIQSRGRAGRSWGCPAVSPKLAKPLINTIKNGSMVFAYYPDKNYIRNSNYAHA